MEGLGLPYPKKIGKSDFRLYLTGVHFKSTTRWYTLGANDFTFSIWICSTVQVDPKMPSISFRVWLLHGVQSLPFTFPWMCRIPPLTWSRASQATWYDTELKRNLLGTFGVKISKFHTYLDGISPRFTWWATFFGAIFRLSPSNTVHLSWTWFFTKFNFKALTASGFHSHA